MSRGKGAKKEEEELEISDEETKRLEIQGREDPHDLALVLNHYWRRRHSLRAKRGSGSTSQPRRVWQTLASCNFGLGLLTELNTS